MQPATDQGLYIHVPVLPSGAVTSAPFIWEIHHPRAAAGIRRLTPDGAPTHADSSPFDHSRLGSIYFGGGTPTTQPRSAAQILLGSERHVGLASDGEVTVEAHPGR